nr:hypothetical protein Itr_chr04CG17020 [Ipomoea trifida]
MGGSSDGSPSSPLAVPPASPSASDVALIKEKNNDDATAGNPASSSPLCNAKDNRRSTLFVTPQSSTDRDSKCNASFAAVLNRDANNRKPSAIQSATLSPVEYPTIISTSR